MLFGCYECPARVEAESLPKGWGRGTRNPANLCPEHFRQHIRKEVKDAEQFIEWLLAKLGEAGERPPNQADPYSAAMAGGFE